MYTYQIIMFIIVILIIYWSMRNYGNENFNLGLSIGISLIAIVLFVLTLFPQISVNLAEIVGLGRGLDLLYILAFLFILYVLFKLYNMIEDQKRRINQLISQLAIEKHDDDKK
ncbi:DUF2304 domain-containing protein [Methanosphaera cuniculi]|uniref:DUF2304 domain-containing protein n=1 Tax=Methanosphaera cuniculi TaxID=1077256 RepID=UPI0026DC44F3|nr:DUF2304 domain-containing protein [Methanosphaera cuniculi]